MPKNEDGEFELVVGNKQLLTVVFIVMVLFGVIFSMGYYVGRNSAPDTAAAARTAAMTESYSGSRPEAVGAVQTQSAPPESPESTAPVQAVAPENASSATPAASETPSPAQTAAAPEPAPQPPPKAQEPPRPAVRSTAVVTPTPGQTFLQVAAVNRPEAELVSDVLRKKSFPAVIAPGPNATLFRVLVGPCKDAATLGKMKADLEAAGFKSIVRKYQ